MLSQPYTLAISLISFSIFWTAVTLEGDHKYRHIKRPPFVYVDGPTQIILYAGDRFLAANIESIRATASVSTTGTNDFIVRSHKGVSRLNPCHEDNYWISNASLSWGGAEHDGFEILHNAMHCRYWDEWPAFFYGFNKYFFEKDTEAARHAIELAAQRSNQNTAAFRNLSIMLAVEKLDDTSMAIKMLEHERDLPTTDTELREMLDKRVVRLQGLLALRDAQKAYETQYNTPLTSPQELLDGGLLTDFPEDPLGLGYEFRDQTFHLRQMKIE